MTSTVRGNQRPTKKGRKHVSRSVPQAVGGNWLICLCTRAPHHHKFLLTFTTIPNLAGFFFFFFLGGGGNLSKMNWRSCPTTSLEHHRSPTTERGPFMRVFYHGLFTDQRCSSSRQSTSSLHALHDTPLHATSFGSVSTC